ncbi:MAG: hypothetical protein M1383_06225 [Patescibacteria group bacterium]|nr:hypothetical protein [Patescibacteria group bacterium]
MKIGIFTAICDRDFNWVPQFMKQAEILQYPVAWYADRLLPENLVVLKNWKLTVGIVEGKDQFSEKSKEKAFNLLTGFDWAIQMDIDETWQDGAKEIIEKTLAENPGHQGYCPMITVARRDDKLYRRMDDYFLKGKESGRERIYNLQEE